MAPSPSFSVNIARSQFTQHRGSLQAAEAVNAYPGGVTPETPPGSHRSGSCECTHHPASASVVKESPRGNVGCHKLGLSVLMRVREVDGEDSVLLLCVDSVKGAGALGHITEAFTVQGLVVKSLFFFFFFFFSPGVDTQGIYLLQAWFCQNTGLIPVPTDMQGDREVPQRNRVTL